jgi:hypothetical protein
MAQNELDHKILKTNEKKKLKGKRTQVIAEKIKKSIRRNLTGYYPYEFDK